MSMPFHRGLNQPSDLRRFSMVAYSPSLGKVNAPNLLDFRVR